MSPLLVNIGVVLFFVLLGGFFAAAEMALVSLRESQVSRLCPARVARASGGAAARATQPVPLCRADRRDILGVSCPRPSVPPRSPTSSRRYSRTGGCQQALPTASPWSRSPS